MCVCVCEWVWQYRKSVIVVGLVHPQLPLLAIGHLLRQRRRWLKSFAVGGKRRCAFLPEEFPGGEKKLWSRMRRALKRKFSNTENLLEL